MINETSKEEIKELSKGANEEPEVHTPEKKESPEPTAERIYLKVGSFEIELSSLRYDIVQLSNLLMQIKVQFESSDKNGRDYLG